MRNPRAIAAKVKKDHALNMSELAVASGYDRSALARMQLPFQEGKISLSDFKRIIRNRQDGHEKINSMLYVFGCDECGAVRKSYISKPQLAGLRPANASPMREVADKFYVPSSKSAARSA